MATFDVKKNYIEVERINVRPELAFYWGNFPVNLMVQNSGGESFPTIRSGYAHGTHAVSSRYLREFFGRV